MPPRVELFNRIVTYEGLRRRSTESCAPFVPTFFRLAIGLIGDSREFRLPFDTVFKTTTTIAYNRRISLKMRNAMKPIRRIMPTCCATSRTRTEGRRRVTAS